MAPPITVHSGRIAAGAVLAVVAVIGWAPAAAQDALVVKSAVYPTIISGHACAEDSATNKIYCFGGIEKVSTNAPETAAIVEYDPATDTIVQKVAELPSPRTDLSCAEDSSSHLIYCFGGYSQEFTCTVWDGDNCVGGYVTSQAYDEILRYSPQTDSLSVIPTALSAGTSDMGCVESSSSHRIYCLGGFAGGRLDQIVEFDPATGGLQLMTATLPTGRYGMSCVESSDTNRISCFGGMDALGRLNEIVEYTPATDSLSTRSAILPSRVTELSCAEDSATNRIFCSGGVIQSVAYVENIYAYDPTADELSLMTATLPSGRYGLACTEDSSSHRIYCIGGSRSVVSIDEVTEYTPGPGGTPVCPDRDDDYYFDEDCGGTDCDDDPAECGIACNPGKLEDCDGYDNNCDGQIDEGDVCEIIPVRPSTLPWAVSDLSCTATTRNLIYCFGGGDDYEEIIEYIPAIESVSTKTATLPIWRIGLSCATDTSTDLIYCFGGGSSPGNVDILEYDPVTDSVATKAATIPSARSGLSCTEDTSTHRLYCFGGTAGQSANFDDILEYNPTTDTLTTKTAKLPLARAGLTCAEDSSSHRIYCFGGYLWSGVGGPPYFSEIVEYDPALDSVEIPTSRIPTYGRRNMGCAEDSLNHNLYCFGGFNHMVSANDEVDFFEEILRFDPTADSLSTEGLSLPTRRAYLPCVENSTSNEIYCFGGRSYPGTTVYYDQITDFTPTDGPPANHPPVAGDDFYWVPSGATLSQVAPGVLGNDTDADGHLLTALLVTPPAGGALTMALDGSFAFTPPPGFVGEIVFSYLAIDGVDASNIAPVRVSVGEMIFEDGFESGDLSKWSPPVP